LSLNDVEMPESKSLKLESESEPELMVPARLAGRKKRKVESSCDEMDMMELDVKQGPLQSVEPDSVMLESEDTRTATARKPAPGKKFVKVKKTRYSTVDGFMQAEDYSSVEEVDLGRADETKAVKVKP
jgi:hypothetical protein